MFARRGLELAGDRDAEGRWRCGMRAGGPRSLSRAGSPRAPRRYVSLAVPGRGALDSPSTLGGDVRHLRGGPRRSPPIQRAGPGHRLQPLDASVQPLHHGRDRQTGRRLDLRPAALPRQHRAGRDSRHGPHVKASRRSGSWLCRRPADRYGRHSRGYRRPHRPLGRIGAWTQQWTTLRNAADLFDQLGDHDLASFLRTAADEAPEAASLTSIASPAAADSRGDADPERAVDTTQQTRTRELVLDVTRQAIARWLSVTRQT